MLGIPEVRGRPVRTPWRTWHRYRGSPGCSHRGQRHRPRVACLLDREGFDVGIWYRLLKPRATRATRCPWSVAPVRG